MQEVIVTGWFAWWMEPNTAPRMLFWILFVHYIYATFRLGYLERKVVRLQNGAKRQ